MMSAKINSSANGARRFEFARDSFAFANELLWEYHFDPATGKTTFRKREPKPYYAHRCFVLTSAARKFLYHARFDASQKAASEETYRKLIREVLSRNPRVACEPEKQIVIPGFASLREFSVTHEKLLKAECGGAWRSYVLRSHWRMIFPISRAHQTRTAEALAAELRQNDSPIIHLVKFPALTINHGMILFEVAETARGFEFQAYDPNHPPAPVTLTFDRTAQTFFLPANSYWAGGEMNIIEIFRGWFM
jgi:hypothetical protein